MPAIETRHFGRIDCPDDAVYEFPQGIPGFEDEKRFLFVEQPHAHPVVFMQSLSTAGLCFLTVPVHAVQPGYQLRLLPEDLAELGLPAERQPEIGRETLCLAIVSLEANQPPTANLLSPIVVNLKSRVGLQAIQADATYSHRHPFGQPEGGSTCS